MTEVLVDSNVILDVVTDNSTWFDWSVNALAAAALRGPLLINDIVFAEVSVRYTRIEEVEDLVDGMQLAVERIPRSGLFLGALAMGRYREAGGKRDAILPDFFIGAHAATTARALLTRDRARFRTYFPTVELITP